jgi:hypothetical protein
VCIEKTFLLLLFLQSIPFCFVCELYQRSNTCFLFYFLILSVKKTQVSLPQNLDQKKKKDMLNRPYNDSQYQNTYNRSNYYGGSSNDIDPRLPFPPSIPPPPLPPPTASMGYAVGGWGANRGAVGGEGNSNINNNGVDYSRGGSNHFLPGGTWHTAALYTGAFPTAAQQYQQENSNTQPNETAPIGQQIPPYIANKETFPHQNNNNNNMDVSSIREGSQGRRPLANNHNQQHPITASGMEMQAMQRLISSARTRFVPSNNQMD